MDDKERVNVMTPINRYEWPLPIPKDANLDLIRIEMLNLRAKYAWLDVLCLRQPGGRGGASPQGGVEARRAHNWICV